MKFVNRLGQMFVGVLNAARALFSPLGAVLAMVLIGTESARADGIDLAPITANIALVALAVVAALGAVALTGLSVGAVIWGGKAVWRFFKGMAH